MALDPEARRAEGVSQISASDLQGSRGKDGVGWALPTATAGNPGPTPNLRGIEPNTGKSEGSNVGEPVITQTFGSEVPRGEVTQLPWNATINVVGDEPDGWQTYDSASNNSVRPDWPQHGSFHNFGENYPANPSGDTK